MEIGERAGDAANGVPVVGIGASAGGLEAISEMLTSLPADTGMAFLLVQHLDPSHPTMLPEILAKKTAMPVREATEGLDVQPDHLYVIPPNAVMRIEQGRLRLTPRRETPGPPMPIDELFHSIADQQGHTSIGVILSGGGSDGAKGMQALKHAGGITIAQDEASARFPDMPRAAAALESVDFVLTPPAIAQEIARIGRHPYLGTARLRGTIDEPIPADEDSLRRIFLLLRGASGVDFTHYKRPTVNRRLARRLALHHLESIDQYVRFLEATPGEAAALCSDLLIRVTRFFREPKTYEALVESEFPRLLDQRSPNASVRIWVPGCASGEEVYSIAISLLEYLGERASQTRIQIFGTDLSETAIETARAGYYVESIASEVSAARLTRFFVKENAHYRIAHSIRDLCVFARHDVTRDPPFSRLDLISCQNLLIYLEPMLQQRVIPFFHYALKPGGVLVLSPAETIGPGFSDRFSLRDGTRARIFVKKDLPAPPHWESSAPPVALPRQSAAPASAGDAPLSGSETLQREADRIVLARYAPASVLCDEDLNVLQFRGDTGPFLTHAPGPSSLNLQRLARPGLDIEIARAVRKARAEGAPVRKAGLRIEASEGLREVDLDVLPIGRGEATGPCFLICFDVSARDATRRSVARPATIWASLQGLLRPGSRPSKAAPAEEVAQLTDELRAARDHVRTMREEHESALEELKSAQEELLSSNEEFQSTNEELETSKEELQAANEELVTTNEEMQHRNLDLNRLNTELVEARESSNAIVETMRQPILILDSELRVFRANAAFLETFRTTHETTVGRSIYALGDGQWEIPDLRRLLEEVLPAKTAIEAFEVRHVFPVIGAKTMLLSARRLRSEKDALILLAIDDATERQAVIDDLDAASHRKDEFLAMLAHELRNPLAAMRNALELWRQPNAGAAARARAQSIFDGQLQKETRLVDDLLDLSRISRGSVSLRLAPLDLVQVVSRAMDEMRHELDARHHQVEMSLPPEPVAVEGDAVRLEQVVVNLLANSAKFTQPGGHIAVTLERDGDTAVLSVRDDGIGILAEQISTIFDLFFQVDRSLDRNPGGLGLGLTLVRRLVELHGGSVEARSPGRDQGSEFVVRLPISGAPLAAATLPRAVAPPCAPRRILVVDDNLDAAESLTMLLQLGGHDVRRASHGRAALAAAASFAPEIVLLDIGLPGMDGYEVATGLRAQAGGDQMVLVAVTGYGRAEDRQRAREACFDHYLLKPIDFAALAEILAA